MLPRHRPVNLLKLLEDRLQIGLRNAGARIAHRDDKLLTPGICVRALDLHVNVSLLGELQRITEQINHHLPEPGRVLIHLHYAFIHLVAQFNTRLDQRIHRRADCWKDR